MKISIIIPTYNVEPYICRCLESVFEQTYRHLEVIIVDDCSSDRTMGKVQDFIGGHFCKDIVFKYLMHDCNRGAGAARNTGIMDGMCRVEGDRGASMVKLREEGSSGILE